MSDAFQYGLCRMIHSLPYTSTLTILYPGVIYTQQYKTIFKAYRLSLTSNLKRESQFKRKWIVSRFFQRTTTKTKSSARSIVKNILFSQNNNPTQTLHLYCFVNVFVFLSILPIGSVVNLHKFNWCLQLDRVTCETYQ